jgi:hypothetical protein
VRSRSGAPSSRPRSSSSSQRDVEVAVVDLHLELSALGTAPFDDVHVGHDLDAADERLAHLRRQLDDVAERAVDAEPTRRSLRPARCARRDAVAQRLRHDLVDDLHDPSAQVDDLVDRFPATSTMVARLNASMSVPTADSAL